MPTMQYCWRCKTEVPMFNESEWPAISRELTLMTKSSQTLRETAGATLDEALKTRHDGPLLAKHLELTGLHATSGDALWHHRLIDFGPPCANCGRLLRTTRAKICAECGANV
jgi:hypothetical protein